MARVKWAIETYENANHNPHIVLNGLSDKQPLFLSKSTGDVVELDASSSQDPDGDDLHFDWYVYEEIYKPKSPILLEMEVGKEKVRLKVPDLHNGESIHIILEVTDNGTPALTSYKRIIISSNK
jgi:hypothetical protein